MDDNRNNQNHSSVSWFAVFLAWIFFWPLGLVLLLKKLSDEYAFHANSRPARSTPERPSTATYTQPVSAARPASAAQPTVRKTKLADTAKDLFVKKRERVRKLMAGIGAALAAIGGIGAISEISDLLTGASSGIFGLAVALLMFAVPGAVLLGLSQRIRNQLKLYRRCTAIIGSRKVVRLDELAQVSSVDRKKLCNEIEDLIEAGAMPGAYIDYSRDLLVLSSEGLADNDVFKSAQSPRFGVTDDSAYSEKDRYIRQIRQINDEIADEALSRKIDRIEQVTAKMFEAVERDPAKRPQIASFLSYYLPTTLKILTAYRNFENDTARGANISAAMHDIELATETVVKSFENQLDKLYENDALDVSTDISVLESMLAKDGLTREENGPRLTL